MGREIPKNVRQIGNVSDSPKIYVEDYVDTFLLQMCDKAKEGPIGAFLVGDIQKSDDEEYVYIYGAIQMHELKLDGNEYIIDDETWKNAYEDCKQYFEDGEMLGWFVAQPGIALSAERNIVKLHKKSFPKQNTVFVIKEAVEKEEAYFVHKLNDLLEIGGHYTYYEKNPCMQNYMIASRRKNGVSPSETVEDRAAKDFRTMVRGREVRGRQKKTNRLMYAASALLVLVVMVMGVTTLNNFDKMRSVQNTLNHLTDSISEGGKSVQAKATSGEVTVVQGDTGEIASNTGTVNQDTGQVDSGAAQEDTDTGQKDGQASDTGEILSTETTEEEQGQGDAALDNDGIYLVEEGDTLAIISRKAYGDISHVEAICKMNGIKDGNLIYVGQKLLLP